LFAWFEDRLVEDITLGEWIDFFDQTSKKNRVTSGAILKQLKIVLNWSVRRQLISNVDVLQLRVSDIGSASTVGSRVLTILECGKINGSFWLGALRGDKRSASLHMKILGGCVVVL
jgi:hypothetical protein